MSSTSGSRSVRTPRVGSELSVQELSRLAEKAPEAYRDLMQQKILDQRHRRRIAWAGLIAQGVGHLSGLAALSVLATVAWHAFDLGAANQGAAIICTGAVSIVAIFVTGRLTSKESQPISTSIEGGSTQQNEDA